MEINEIKALLEQYYDGVIEDEEEQKLIEYFNSDYVHPDLIVEKDIFNRLHQSDIISESTSLGEKLRTNVLVSDKDVESRKQKSKIFIFVTAIAACITLFLYIGNVYQNNNVDATVELIDTYDDPQKAYIEAEKALLKVSVNYNKGLSILEQAQTEVNKSEELVLTNFNRLNIH